MSTTAINSLRAAFANLSAGTSASVKGKGRALSLRTLKTSAAIPQAPVASVSTGPLPTEPITATTSALQLLKTQPSHYVVASLAGRTYMVTASDIVTLPRLKDVQPGDVIELDRIHELGGRDYTLRAQDPMHCRNRGPGALMRRSVNAGLNSAMASSPSDAAQQTRAISNSWATRLHPAGLAHVGATLSPSVVRVRAIILEHTKGSMELKVKKKRRKGYRKTITHKQPYTRLRIERIEVAPQDGA